MNEQQLAILLRVREQAVAALKASGIVEATTQVSAMLSSPAAVKAMEELAKAAERVAATLPAIAPTELHYQSYPYVLSEESERKMRLDQVVRQFRQERLQND